MMNAAVAPLATIEDLSDIENGTDDDHSDQYAEINTTKEDIVISARRSASRIRVIGEGPELDMSAEKIAEPRQSTSEALLENNGNRAEIPDRMAKHHMVLVHMKPENRSCVQTFLMTPVRRTSCLSGESSGIFCRICHEGDGREDLISPCKCTGTMGLIHVSCIEKWLSQAGTSKCEICGFEYVTEKTPKSFFEWIRQPARPNDKRNLYGDLACFALLTPLAGVSSWLCLSGAIHYSKFEKTKWETAGLITLAVFLILIYAIWCMVASRYHIRVIRDWRKANQVVRIMPREDPNILLGDGDTNNNCLSSRVTSPTRHGSLLIDQSAMSVNYPHEATSTRNMSVRKHLSNSQNSLARNLSSELVSAPPVAASSPVHPTCSGYPDILESSAAACLPSTSQSARIMSFPHDVQRRLSRATTERSYPNEKSLKHNSSSSLSPTQAYLPGVKYDNVMGGLGKSKSFTSSLLHPQEHREILEQIKNARGRSSLSESACQGNRSLKDNDSSRLSVVHIVKETYV